MIVNGRSRQDQVRLGTAQDRRHAAPRIVIVIDRQIAKLAAKVFGADQGRASGRLLPPDRGDLGGAVMIGAAIARGHRHDRNVMPLRDQQGQCAAGEDLGIVRVRVDVKDSHKRLVNRPAAARHHHRACLRLQPDFAERRLILRYVLLQQIL